ncbi:MAG TPA: ABC transporter permease subunit [Oscillospiraceae bacterium]|nr:ABC transporter permease subunit [Oscillospiraceae bacterium]HPF56176.1 ABC transporter permease subunit [Clostridiales bacterium]HPK36045.1 ABC transporter permease subunit [Oscillospiraceae bacterium]HPR75976.1 ABC transporter permease subunit [Oscillospiraceae bacterium]
MFNATLYRREIKGSWKLFVIFAAVLTMYIVMIVGMYNPELSDMLDEFAQVMPDLMNAVGMKGDTSTLLGFMATYLYGMLFSVFPMVFSIIRANALIAKYVDRGSMVALLAAPVKRKTVAFTQMAVLGTCIVALVAYITAMQLIAAQAQFPGELDIGKLLLMNAGLLCLQLFIGGICFFASCLFSDAKYSVAVGAGVPVLMYVIRMLANMGGDLEKAKYLTFFTLFNSDKILAGDQSAVIEMLILLAGAVVLFIAGITVFSKKDLHI